MPRRADFILVDLVFAEGTVLRFANRTVNLKTSDGILSYQGVISDISDLSSGVNLDDLTISVENVSVTLRNLDRLADTFIALIPETATCKVQMFDAVSAANFLIDVNQDLISRFSIQGNVEDVSYDAETIKFTVTDRSREIFGLVPTAKVFDGMIGYSVGVPFTPSEGVKIVPSNVTEAEETIIQIFYKSDALQADPFLSNDGSMRGGICLFPNSNKDKARIVVRFGSQGFDSSPSLRTPNDLGSKDTTFYLKPNLFFTDSLTVKKNTTQLTLRTDFDAGYTNSSDFPPVNLLNNPILSDTVTVFGGVDGTTQVEFTFVDSIHPPKVFVITENKFVELNQTPGDGFKYADAVTDEQLFAKPLQEDPVVTADGNQSSFSTLFSFVTTSLRVYVDGAIKFSGVDFTTASPQGKSVNFRISPRAGTKLEFKYIQANQGFKAIMVELGMINDSDSVTQTDTIVTAAGTIKLFAGTRSQPVYDLSVVSAERRENLLLSMPVFDPDVSSNPTELIRKVFRSIPGGDMPGFMLTPVTHTNYGTTSFFIMFKAGVVNIDDAIRAFDPIRNGDVFLRFKSRKGAPLGDSGQPPYIIRRVARVRKGSDPQVGYQEPGLTAGTTLFGSPVALHHVMHIELADALNSEMNTGDILDRVLNKQGVAIAMTDVFFRLKKVKREVYFAPELLSVSDIQQSQFFDGQIQILKEDITKELVEGRPTKVTQGKLTRIVTELRPRYATVVGEKSLSGIEMHFGPIGGDIRGTPVKDAFDIPGAAGTPLELVRGKDGFLASQDLMLVLQKFRGGTLAIPIHQYFEASNQAQFNFKKQVNETSEWQLIQFEVSTEGGDIEKVYPIMYGRFLAVELAHIGRYAPASERPNGQQKDFYLLSGHEIGHTVDPNTGRELDPATGKPVDPQQNKILRVFFDLNIPEAKRSVINDPDVISAVREIGLTLPTNPLASTDFRVYNNRIDNRGRPVSYVVIDGPLFGLGSSRIYADFTGIDLSNPVDILVDFIERFTTFRASGFTVDERSVGDARQKRENYVCAVHVREEVDALEVVKRISFGAAIVPILKRGKLRIKTIDFSGLKPKFLLEEDVNVLENPAVSRQNKATIYSEFEIRFQYDFINNVFRDRIEISPANNTSASRAELLFGPRKHETFELPYIFEKPIAEKWINEFMLPFFTRQRVTVELDTIKEGLEGIEEMDVIALTHSVGAVVDGKGWRRKLFWVTEIKESPVRFHLKLVSIEANEEL